MRAQLPPLLQATYRDSVLALRSRTKPETYESWLRKDPLWQWTGFNRRIVSALDRVERGEIKRLLVTIPSRYGKSEPISRRFAAYYLRRHPSHWVGLASYGADTAEKLSMSARDHYIGSGQDLTVKKRQHWETGQGGGMWSAGIGGAIVSKGFHVGIIDDPTKRPEDAISVSKQHELQNFWSGVWITRQEPGAAIIVVMQRWHEEDFVGWLYEQESENPQHWHVLAFDAIHSEEPYGIPETCTLEPDWREPGETLWPERISKQEIEGRIASAGEWAGAIYQQRPKSEQMEGRVAVEWSPDFVRKIDRNKDARLILGVDFNVDPMSGIVGQVDGKRIHWFKEYQLYGSDTQQLAAAVRKDFPDLIDCYPDASGKARSTSGNSDFEILRAAGFRIHARGANPAVRNRISSFNACCRRKQIAVDPSCATAIKAYKRLRYKPGTNDIDKSSGLDHIFDASTYAVEYMFPIRVPRPGRVRVKMV